MNDNEMLEMQEHSATVTAMIGKMETPTMREHSATVTRMVGRMRPAARKNTFLTGEESCDTHTEQPL